MKVLRIMVHVVVILEIPSFDIMWGMSRRLSSFFCVTVFILCSIVFLVFNLVEGMFPFDWKIYGSTVLLVLLCIFYLTSSMDPAKLSRYDPYVWCLNMCLEVNSICQSVIVFKQLAAFIS